MVKKKLVGRYIVGQTIGEGSFAKVCLAQDKDTLEVVAAKVIDVLSMERRGMSQMLEASRREAAIMKKLRHPYVVDYKAALYAKNEGKLYLIMEYCAGGELFSRIESGEPLPEKTARRFFQQVISGLEYVHSLGIAHRDLKLENILLDGSNNCKICDFGFSKMQRDDLLSTPCGSRVYAAPEVVDPTKRYDGFLADVFSCGIILYAMITARMPYRTTKQAIEKNLSWGSHCVVDESCKDLVSRMLEPDPTKRISIAEIKEHPWFLVDFIEEPVVAPPEEVTPTAQELRNTYQEEVAQQQVHSLPREDPKEMHHPLDAFSLASILMSGTLDLLFVPSNSVHAAVYTSTQVTVDLGSEQCMELLKSSLESINAELRGPSPRRNSHGYQFKCILQDGLGDFLIFTALFLPVLEDLTIVTFRRLHGNVLAFNTTYHEILKLLGNHVSSSAPALNVNLFASVGSVPAEGGSSSSGVPGRKSMSSEEKRAVRDRAKVIKERAKVEKAEAKAEKRRRKELEELRRAEEKARRKALSRR